MKIYNMNYVIKTLLTVIVLNLIKIYKIFISPILGSNCRYYPTCSSYAYEAYIKYGLIKGSLMSIRRLISCNPFGGHGFDPILCKSEKNIDSI